MLRLSPGGSRDKIVRDLTDLPPPSLVPYLNAFRNTVGSGKIEQKATVTLRSLESSYYQCDTAYVVFAYSW